MKKVLGFLALLMAIAMPALAGGPLVVATDGQSVGWNTASCVRYRTDLGNLGLLSNRQAVALVNKFFRTWQDVPTATIAFCRAGAMSVDVDETNFGRYMGPYGGATKPLGRSVIVFDADGAIFDMLYGIGTGIVGFAAPTWFSNGKVKVAIGDPVPPGSKTIEGLAFLNGKFLDGIDDPAHGNYELAQDLFNTVFVHEFGHFAGLDHTQIHGMKGTFQSVTQPVETMFPYLMDSGQLTLERDDVVALSCLYPAKGFLKSTGQIKGRIMTPDRRRFSGANVIARNIAKDRDAVSFVSGASITNAGAYTLAGLTPGQRYRVEIQQIDPYFTGGSRVGPISPPMILPGPPEFYNGAAESADPAIDHPLVFTPITAVAGVTKGNVNVVMNRQIFSVKNISLNEPNGQLQDFAIGDFDQDGIVDFVSTQSGFTPGNLTRFHRGLGGGAFAMPVTVESFPGNEFVEAGQFNSADDDFLDIVVGSSSLNEVRLYLGNGDGSFGSPTTLFADPGAWIMRALSLGELNGDPYPDLVSVMENWDGSGTAYGLLGSESGAFTVVATSLAAGSGFPQFNLAISQILGSAHPDVIGFCQDATGNSLGFLVGDGEGGFTVAPRFPLAFLGGTSPFLAVADLDRNGTLDVVVANPYPVGIPMAVTRSWMAVLSGDGNGGFSLSTRYWVRESSFQRGIAVADLNRDGHLDIASSGWDTDRASGAKVNLVFGDGQGGFSEVPSTIWGLAERPESMFAADLDGDGRMDLLLSTSETSHIGPAYQGNYSVLLNRIENTD